MATRKQYERPDGVRGTANLSLSLTVWEDGTVTAALASWAAGERIRHYRLPNLKPEGSVAPPGIEAIGLACDEAIDMWAAGQLR